LLKKIKSNPNVEYLGKIKDLNQYYRSSHVLICPSIIDAGPMTIIEAQYCGLPVIASENCGYSYLIESDQTGQVYKNNDSGELATQINWFTTHKSMIPEMDILSHSRIIDVLKTNSSFNSKVHELIKAI